MRGLRLVSYMPHSGLWLFSHLTGSTAVSGKTIDLYSLSLSQQAAAIRSCVYHRPHGRTG